MQNLNLNSPEWRDLIFEGKNKKYGAYELRSSSDNRHIRALSIVSFLVVSLILFSLIPENKVTIDEPVTGIYGNPHVIDDPITKQIEIEVEETLPVIEQPLPPVRASLTFVPPVIAKRDEITKETEITTIDEILASTADVGTQTVITDKKGEVHVDDIPKAAEVVVQAKQEVIERFVEELPTFPGGQAELMKYLSSNLRYPVPALESEIEGRVVVEFVVSKTGEISNVKVLQSLHPSCDKEAERLIRKMPKWIPGKQNGNPVNVYFTIPIRFKLEKSR